MLQVDVLELGRELELTALDLAANLLKPAQDRVALALGDDPHGREHSRVRHGAGDVLDVEPLVEADRGINLRHQRSGVACEVSAPQRATALDLFRHDPLLEPLGAGMRRTLRLIVLFAALVATSARADAPIETAAPQPLPPLTFETLDGQPASLADFAGKVVVLNLWATWCAPCREEMPSLDRLQAQFADRDLIVLTLSVDRAGPERVQKFLDEIGVKQVHVYRDPKAAATRAVRVPGLPATILVNRKGEEVGRVLGIAQWDGPPAVAASKAARRAGKLSRPHG